MTNRAALQTFSVLSASFLLACSGGAVSVDAAPDVPHTQDAANESSVTDATPETIDDMPASTDVPSDTPAALDAPGDTPSGTDTIDDDTTACLPFFVSCTSARACCSGNCNSNGVCDGLSPGSTCAGGAMCRSGECLGGQCACGGAGSACTAPTDCCDGVCVGNVCDAVLDASSDAAADTTSDAVTDTLTDAVTDAATDAVTDTLTDAAGDTSTSTCGAPLPATHEYIYVVDQLTIDANDDPSMPHTGFDMDGFFSGPTDTDGCGHQDFFAQNAGDIDQDCPMVSTDGLGTCLASPNPGCGASAPGCVGGVDNQLPTIANTEMAVAGIDLRSTIAGQVGSSQLVLLIRVSNITDDTNSSNVTVRLYHGYATFTTNCSTVAPCRSYLVTPDSVTSGSTNLDDALFSYTGSIVNGRLRLDAGSASTFSIEPASPMNTFPIDIHAVRLRGDIASDGIRNGNFGGTMDGNELYNAGCTASPSYCSLYGNVISGLVDIAVIEPSTGVEECADTTTSPPFFGNLGAGFGLHAVPATIVGVGPKPPGTCG